MPERRWSGRRIALLALLALVLAGSALLWSARKPIARSYVDTLLAKNGVPAQYEITHFGFRTQRLEHVLIGDTADPDLTADWVEIGFGLSGVSPSLRTIRAKGVRVRGRLVDGRVSFGALDRLLPKPSNAPFFLPDIDVALTDVRMRLATQAGNVGLAFAGKGNLADGFIGSLAMTADRLTHAGCDIVRPFAVLHIAVSDRQPSLDGPVNVARLSCAGSSIADLRSAIDVSFNPTLDRWRGGGMLASGALSWGNYGAASMRGRMSIKGDARNSDAQASFRFDRLRLDGIASALPDAAATPVGPVVVALRRAIDDASSQVDVDASIHWASAGSNRAISIAPVSINSASGAHLNLEASGERGLVWRWPENRIIADGKLSISKGGFPDAILRFSRNEHGFSGKLWMSPYEVEGARVAIDRLDVDQGLVRTRLTLDGPLADGHVKGLDVPIEARIDSRGTVVNPRCFPLSFTELQIAGAHLGPTRLPICPLGGALYVRPSGRAAQGGAMLSRPALRGTIGVSPLLLSARQASVRVGRPGIDIDSLTVRLGSGSDPTRLDIEHLVGETGAGGLAGTLTGAAGKIGGVPLLVSKGEGRWTFRDRALKLHGALALDDAAPDPRFHQLASKDVDLGLRNGVVTGTATLLHPRTGRPVTRVSLKHDLSQGAGGARLDVGGLTFAADLQPEMLTRLTLGVIADARGTIAGSGNIRWNRNGVSSSGDFATQKMDFAAAFGPVMGLAGTIHFSDLLGLQTPPGQTVTLASVNPGVSVEDGKIHYQLLPNQIVRIEDGRWPFSGGELLLEPTQLDFGQPNERHLTFRVSGMDAALFVQQFEFKNIAVTGIFDGTLPMIFDAKGGRIEGGRLVVRNGGGTLAYVGEISNERLGRFGGMAFDALKSVRYSNLAIELNGSLDGEIISRVIFSGTNEAPVAARKGLLGGLVGLPFKFNITIKAPFRSLVNSAQSINDPRGLIQNTLEQRRAAPPPSKSVQPQESEKMR